MASSDLLNNLENETLCPVCLEGYSEDKNLPKAMPCQHTICQVCLQKFIDAEDGGHFKCPSCRESIKVPANGAKGFMTNLTVMALLGYLSDKPRKEDVNFKSVPRKCFVCIKHSAPATHYCAPCRLLLCYRCLGLIIQQESHYRHRILEVQEAEDLKPRLDIHETIQHLLNLKQMLEVTTKSTQKEIEDRCKQAFEDITTRAEEVRHTVKLWEREAKFKITKESRDKMSEVSEISGQVERTIEMLLTNLQEVSEEGDFVQCVQEQRASTKTVMELECSIQNLELLQGELTCSISKNAITTSSIGTVSLQSLKDQVDSPSKILSDTSKGAKYYVAISIHKLDTYIFQKIYDYQEVLCCVAEGIPTVKSIVKNFHQKHQIVQEFALIFDKYNLMSETQMNDLGDNCFLSALVIKPSSDIIVQQHLSRKHGGVDTNQTVFRTFELRKKLPLNTLTQYPMRGMSRILLAANNDVYLQKEVLQTREDLQTGKLFYLSIASAVNPCECFLLRNALGQEERFNTASGILTCVAPQKNYILVMDKTVQVITMYDDKGLFKTRAEYKEGYAKSMCVNEEGLIFIFHSLNYINVLNEDLCLVHCIKQRDLGLGDYPLTAVSCGQDKLQVIFLSGCKKYGMAAYSLRCK